MTSLLPHRRALVTAVAIWAYCGLTLNVVMLVWPVEAIRAWQGMG